jgi:hypothetical protein
LTSDWRVVMVPVRPSINLARSSLDTPDMVGAWDDAEVGDEGLAVAVDRMGSV